MPLPGTKLVIAWWATPSTMELLKFGVYDQPKNWRKESGDLHTLDSLRGSK